MLSLYGRSNKRSAPTKETLDREDRVERLGPQTPPDDAKAWHGLFAHESEVGPQEKVQLLALRRDSR
jgi:hypothetical protein